MANFREVKLSVVLCPYCGSQDIVAPWQVDFNAASLTFGVHAVCQGCESQLLLHYRLHSVNAIVEDIQSIDTNRRFKILE